MNWKTTTRNIIFMLSTVQRAIRIDIIILDKMELINDSLRFNSALNSDHSVYHNILFIISLEREYFQRKPNLTCIK